MFKHLPLRVKLGLAFLFVAVLVAGITVYQVQSVNHCKKLFLDLVDNDLQRLDNLRDLQVSVDKLHSKTLQYEAAVLSGRTVDKTATQDTIKTLGDKIQDHQTKYRTLVRDNPQKLERINAISKQSDELLVAASAILTTQINQKQQLNAQDATIENSVKSLNTYIEATVADDRAAIKQQDAEIDQTILQLIRLNMILASGTVVVALLLGFIMATFLSRSIVKVRRGAERIANGDFSSLITVTSRDELGQLAMTFNEMAERLRDSYSRLAQQRERDETLIANMSDGLIALDSAGRIVLINGRAVEILDLGQRSALVGEPIGTVLDLTDENDKPLPNDYYPARTVLESRTAKNEMYTRQRSDGRKVVVHFSMNPVIVDNQLNGVIMVIRDVTREKEVDRMKTEFISLASHQLRTPLSAIKWFSEMLISGDAGKLTPEQEEFAKNVSDSTERMIDLVNALLNISRIESGRIIVSPKPTDLSEMVNGIVNDLKAKIEERRQTLIISVHKDLPKVDLDPHLIGQVYLTLLTNAIKYTPKGGEISVFVSRKDDELVSQVSDNGYGIPEAEQAKLFQKFFRATNVTKVETDGTGLGLYLIKAIVESSGGKIWYESKEGKGTTFWFSLPMSGMKAKEGEVTLDA